MKTLKIFLAILLLFTFLFAGLSVLTLNFFDGHSNSSGGDYLGGFWTLIFLTGAFLICMIGSIGLGSIVFLPNTSNIVRFLVATVLSVLMVYFALVFTFLPDISFW